MTMGVVEFEEAYERISKLRAQIEQRKNDLNHRNATLSDLSNLFAQSQEFVASLGKKWEEARRGSKSLKSSFKSIVIFL